MRSKAFPVFCFFVLAAVVVFFLLLIASLIGQLRSTTAIHQVGADELLFAVRLTLVTATISSILSLLIALPVAYVLARHTFPLKDTIDSLLYLPIVVSPVALGAMLLIFFGTPLGRLIEATFGRIVFEVPAIVLAQFIVVLGLTVSLVKSTFEHIDPIHENIARTLGASRFKAFTHVLLPLARRGIFSAFLLTWARAVGEFGATVMLAGATAMKTETLTVAIFLSFSSADVHGACVFILISLAVSMAVLFTVRKIYAFP